MRSLRKLLTSVVLRITKQNKKITPDTEILCSVHEALLPQFYTLVQFGISLVLSQAFPTPPEYKQRK